MKYILILIVNLYSHSIQIEHVEFVDQYTCEKALTVIMETHRKTQTGNTTGRQVMGVCVNKGSST